MVHLSTDRAFLSKRLAVLIGRAWIETLGSRLNAASHGSDGNPALLGAAVFFMISLLVAITLAVARSISSWCRRHRLNSEGASVDKRFP